MAYFITAKSDIGTIKSVNQDSILVKVANTAFGEIVFAVVCDGMGGLLKGELASATIVRAYDSWFMTKLKDILMEHDWERKVKDGWIDLAVQQNDRLKEYGNQYCVQLGTTVSCLLVVQNRYIVLNIGDSRVYKLTDGIEQITKDHSYVAREIELGRMTKEEAKYSNQRNVLLQCVGASRKIYPDIFEGDYKDGTVFLLCSDGFRHEISEEEIYEHLNPNRINNEKKMESEAVKLIELNKQRKEKDNISVIVIKA